MKVSPASPVSVVLSSMAAAFITMIMAMTAPAAGAAMPMAASVSPSFHALSTSSPLESASPTPPPPLLSPTPVQSETWTLPPPPRRLQDQAKNQRDLFTHIIISSALGLFAILTFCVMRVQWKSLYGARRRLRHAAFSLPELPNSMFGWIPIVYRITSEEVLASAGLDAYVFLSFYDYAAKLLTTILFFAVTVILPTTYLYTGRYGYPWDGNSSVPDDDENTRPKANTTYLWIYVIFAYVFTGIAVYLLLDFTTHIIYVRQRYLGGQTSMTDRTFRLTGIPMELRTEDKVKNFVEQLGIGRVESVTVCQDWRKLDRLMAERHKTVEKLEKAWTQLVGYRYKKLVDGTWQLVRSAAEANPGIAATGATTTNNAVSRNGLVSSASSTSSSSSSSTRSLLSARSVIGDDAELNERTQLLPLRTGSPLPIVDDEEKPRPTVRIWYGSPIKYRYRKVDAIDYFQEKLRRLDDVIETARATPFPPTPLAFVTMESTAACQMAVQAILDPSPLTLQAQPAPAPADVVWQNTYLPWHTRKIRGWIITLVIFGLTFFWSALLVPLAYLLNLETLEKVIPKLAELLSHSPMLKSLVQTGLPTLSLSLLTIAVPYVYDWLANHQGMVSQGDVELSVISKNFFFTFFNVFLVFTVFATASNFYGLWENLRDVLKDTTIIAFALARSLEKLAPFYTNLIVLQGLGLQPFRLLEFGSVFLYPFQRLGAYTPRDYAQLSNPPTFSYGLVLPGALLIFVICIVYSVFPSSWLVCLFGVIYFRVGWFIYKYQLLYAMDHKHHSTGRAWPMVCSRIIMGLIMFQLTTIGSLALQSAITGSVLIVPLLFATVYFSYFFARTYDPLMTCIALRSIDRVHPSNADSSSSSSDDLDLFHPTPQRPLAPNIHAHSHSGTAAAATTTGGTTGSTLHARFETLRPPRSRIVSPAPSIPQIPSPPSGIERDSVPLRLGGRDVGPRLRSYINPNMVKPLDRPWIPGRRHSRYDTIWAFGRDGEV